MFAELDPSYGRDRSFYAHKSNSVTQGSNLNHSNMPLPHCLGAISADSELAEPEHSNLPQPLSLGACSANFEFAELEQSDGRGRDTFACMGSSVTQDVISERRGRYLLLGCCCRGWRAGLIAYRL